MSITTTNVKNEYTVSAPTSAFSFTFRWFDLDNIEVRHDGVLLVKDTDYTFSGTGSSQIGGQVDLTSSISSGVMLIQRVTPVIQEADYGTTTVFPASSVQGVDDKTVAMIQEIAEVSGDTPIFPTPEADKYLGWNAGGTALENKTIIDDDKYEQLETNVLAAQTTADLALTTATDADNKADQAGLDATGAKDTANAALSKANTNETNLANTEAKASSALSKATNNESAIAAIDTNDFVKISTNEPRMVALESQQAVNTGEIAAHEVDIISLESDVQDLEDTVGQFTQRNQQYIGNNVLVPTEINNMVFNQVESPYAEVQITVMRKTDLFFTNNIIKLNCFWNTLTSLWDVCRASTQAMELDGVTFDIVTVGTVGTLNYISTDIAGANYEGQAYYRADKLLS